MNSLTSTSILKSSSRKMEPPSFPEILGVKFFKKFYTAECPSHEVGDLETFWENCKWDILPACPMESVTRVQILNGVIHVSFWTNAHKSMNPSVLLPSPSTMGKLLDKLASFILNNSRPDQIENDLELWKQHAILQEAPFV